MAPALDGRSTRRGFVPASSEARTADIQFRRTALGLILCRCTQLCDPGCVLSEPQLPYLCAGLGQLPSGELWRGNKVQVPHSMVTGELITAPSIDQTPPSLPGLLLESPSRKHHKTSTC